MRSEGETLKFKNGKFKVMHITDTQESAAVAKDTLKLINAALDAEKPDLVVFTGDQIKGYSVTFLGKNKEEIIKKTIGKIIEPVVKRNIPFAVTFGNHDRQTGISNDRQIKFYEEYSQCVKGANVFGSGTYTVPVEGADGKPAMNIYMVDSGGDAKGGGYEAVTPEQIEWYKSARESLKEQAGKYVPSIVFQHIPVSEYYNVLRRVGKHDKNAVRAFRTHKNEYYVPEEKVMKDSDYFMLEPPSIPDVNTGEFEAMKEKGDVFAIFVGHDHKNSFVGTYDGIDLGYTPSCGFNVYGEGTKRAVRVFEFSEENPADYKTRTLSFRNLIGRKVQTPVKDFLFKYAPTTVDAAIPMIIKAVIAIFGIAAAIALISFIF